MSQTSRHPGRMFGRAGAALAVAVAAVSWAAGAGAVAPTDAPGAEPTALPVATPAIRWGDRDVILAQINSEYLLELAQSWYPSAAPRSGADPDAEACPDSHDGE